MGITWINNHISDDRTLDAYGSVTDYLQCPALLRQIREQSNYKPLNQGGKPIIYIYIYIYIYISGGICITLGNDSMSDSKQKSSYEHGSDFERLRSYGHFLIPVHALK